MLTAILVVTFFSLMTLLRYRAHVGPDGIVHDNSEPRIGSFSRNRKMPVRRRRPARRPARIDRNQ